MSRTNLSRKKKGADTGIDGVKFFGDLDRKEVRKMVVSVKGGGIKPDDVRGLNIGNGERGGLSWFLRKRKHEEVSTRAVANDLWVA